MTDYGPYGAFKDVPRVRPTPAEVIAEGLADFHGDWNDTQVGPASSYGPDADAMLAALTDAGYVVRHRDQPSWREAWLLHVAGQRNRAVRALAAAWDDGGLDWQHARYVTDSTVEALLNEDWAQEVLDE